MYYRGLCSRRLDPEKHSWPLMKMRLVVGWTTIASMVWPLFVLLIFHDAPLEWFVMAGALAAAHGFILLGYLTPPRQVRWLFQK
ncbi:hypothetical protein KW797_03310 [Candidatus Parcubacteria bacterium]|nr:hypothetical protein [Candidatus Parcubacteria bacterium]